MSSVSGLSRLYCATCGTEEVHKGMACIHCHTPQPHDAARLAQRERMERSEAMKIQALRRKGGPGRKKAGV